MAPIPSRAEITEATWIMRSHFAAVSVLSIKQKESGNCWVLWVGSRDSARDFATNMAARGLRVLRKTLFPLSLVSCLRRLFLPSKTYIHQAISNNNDKTFSCFLFPARSSPPSSPRAAPYLHTHPGAAQPVSISPESAKKYRNPATIPETFSTTVDSRGNHSGLSSRSSSQSSLSLASSLSPQQSGGMNVGRLEPLIQAPSDGVDTSSELFSPTT